MGNRRTVRVRRTFTPQFKKDAVALISADRSLTEVANDLGVARSLLRGWHEQLRGSGAGVHAPAGHCLGSDGDEVRRLRKQLRDVTEERDILKKALAYFADDRK